MRFLFVTDPPHAINFESDTGAVLRVPRADDIASNLRMGGTAQVSLLDEADQRIIATVAPRLRRDGLYFVEVDVLGGFLTEVNVTSPTGIQQISRLNRENVAKRVIEWTVAKAAQLRSTSSVFL